MLSDGESVVKVSGGTHNPLVPSADYLSELFLPMAMAGSVAFTVRRITNHLKTNMAVVGKFLDVTFEVEKLDEGFGIGVS